MHVYVKINSTLQPAGELLCTSSLYQNMFVSDSSDVISKYFTVIKHFHEWKRGQITSL